MRALAIVRGEAAIGLMRPHLDDRDPRLAVTAAAALAASSNPDDVDAAEATLERLSGDPRPSAAAARQEVAQALGAITNPRFRRLLVPLMYDPQREVALEAIKSAGRLGAEDYMFVPPLVSLLRNRLLKASARQVLVGYGEGVIDTLAYFLRDPDEDIWVRRHIPSTLAQIPSQKTMDVLVDALGESDGFLRFKVINALLRLKQSHPQFALPAERVQPLLVQESNRYFSYLSLHYNLVHKDPAAKETLIARALQREARAHARPPLSAAGAALSVEGHLGGALVARARRCARQGQRRRVPGQPARQPGPQARDAGARGPADRGEGPARQPAAQDARARRRGQPGAAGARRGSDRGGRGDASLSSSAASGPASPTTSSTRSSIATRRTGTCSRRRRGRWPASA